MKKSVFHIIVLTICIAVTVFSARKDEVTVLLIPREDSALRVGMDIANRYPTLLLSYKIGVNGAVSLHGWSGIEWVNVSLEDYHSGNFFRTGPDSCLLIEETGKPVPESILPPEEWCVSAYAITTTEVRPLLHLVGQYYDFKYKDWNWFSDNYELPMEAINPEGLNVSWYHKRLTENLSKRDAIVAEDLKFWRAIRYPKTEQPAQENPIIENSEDTVVEEEPSSEISEQPIENPLTNAVPEAVILGAGNAETVTPALETE